MNGSHVKLELICNQERIFYNLEKFALGRPYRVVWLASALVV